MEQSWPHPSPRVAEIWRRAAQAAFDSAGTWFGERAETLRGGPLRPIAEDPVLAEAVQRGNVAVLRQWAFANMHAPGRRVAADVPPELLASARDMVRRGLDTSVLNAYRTGQSLAWRHWMQTCFALAAEPADLPELFDLSAQSANTFIDDIVDAVGEAMDAERRALTRGTHAERLTAATLLIEGATITPARAESQLGYRLTGPHTAAIVWDESATAAGELDAAAEILTRHSGGPGRLTVIASANALWLWLPTATVLDTAALTAELSAFGSIRVAIGRPGRGVDGFRRSHLEAATTQQLLARLTAPQQVARYDDIAVVALMTRDPALADEFVHDTLGELLTAEPETLTVLRAYIQLLCNTSRTAQHMFIHRNTIIRRLARADELLPKPLSDNILAVAAALEILHWRGEPASRHRSSAGR